MNRDCPDNNTGVGCYSLLQGTFLTQGSNLGLLHCRQILYHLSHQGRPEALEGEEKINQEKMNVEEAQEKIWSGDWGGAVPTAQG